MKIISWNIRGLGSSVKNRIVTKLIKDKSPDVLLLQETKIVRFKMSVAQRMWGSFVVEYAESGAMALWALGVGFVFLFGLAVVWVVGCLCPCWEYC
ncbi:hypothetical protein RHGRI_007162 [Rhododendron griersonianum]|uniref:Endonuclease/exonuclease/phosphatase domain-containing protein n=1 Tax=Rhododendron griersonianum TaxID=479676 RepID=A0AAV6KYU0_9ERIC|nr:hypothetical protein RHGRI_007162 [Rhododendron griersonianum]